jgi:hypothetical protein
VEITKNISEAFKAFKVPPESNQVENVVESVEIPKYLKGIDSYHDLGKSEDILHSLVQIKECFFMERQKEIFRVHNLAREKYAELAKKCLEEIYMNTERDNPKRLLNDLDKYREKESNPVISFLWFVRDVSHHLVNEKNFSTFRAVANFLLDRKFISSQLIPIIFRLADKNFRPDYDELLGRSFMNLRPFFLPEFDAESLPKQRDILIGVGSRETVKEYILLATEDFNSIDDLRSAIAKETLKTDFHLQGEYENVKTRISKIENLRHTMKVFILEKQSNTETDE